MSLAVKPVYSKREFLTSAYCADDGGEFHPVRPLRCPDSKSGCKIEVLRWRDRKHGPGYPLRIFRCFKHKRVFTIYPPDWTPYARKSFAALTPDGADSVFGDSERDAWATTIFQAVVDAADGRRWPENAEFVVDERGLLPGGVFRTQCRHIHGALNLFAIVDEKNRREQEKVAAYFGVGVPFLIELTKIRAGPWWRRTGEAVARILEHLGFPRRRYVPKFVDLGFDRKYWGPAPPLLSRAFIGTK